jgi:hypothetical protein
VNIMHSVGLLGETEVWDILNFEYKICEIAIVVSRILNKPII